MTNYDFLYNKNFYGDSLFKEHLCDKKLSFRTFEDAIIFPLNDPANNICALDSNGNYIENSCIDNDIAKNLTQNLRLENIELSVKDANAILLGRFINVWGHFITDDLRNIWFLKSKSYESYTDFELIYQDFTPGKNYTKFFDILDINYKKFRSVTTPTRFKKIIIPDECFITEHEENQEFGLKYSFTNEYVELINYVRDYAQKNKTELNNKKFYFSYSKYKSGKSVGENHIENYLRKNGFEIIYPENHSLDEQLNILANCEFFASTIGSCSHNMLFLNDDSKVMLIPRANYLTPYQLAIDKVHNLQIFYVDSTFSFLAASKNPAEGPFLYIVSSNMKKFFNDKNSKIEVYFKDYKKYFKYAMGLNFGRRFGFNSGGGSPKTHNYYSGEIASEYYGELLNSGFPLFRKISDFAREIVKKYFMKYVVK